MNYLEFGSIINNKKKNYEFKKGKLYDDYMLTRYFNDIYLFSRYKNQKDIKKISRLMHDKKDLKFNFINMVLISINKKKFYEFGFTLLEKILLFKLIGNLFNFNGVSLKKIKYCGNDISKKFLFFSNNFFKEYKLSLSKKLNIKDLKNSVFFAKGVSILYEKNNLDLLNSVIKKSNCGSFDLSLSINKKSVKRLETGYKLYYPSYKNFMKLVKINKSKVFLFKNIKIKRNLVYFETVYGEKNIINKFIKKFNFYKKKYNKVKALAILFNLNTKFYYKLKIS